MRNIKSRRLTALVAGMVILAALGFNIATVQAHGHGGGGHGGGGHGGGGFGGGHHHGGHAHTHFRGGEHGHEGLKHDSHYHHDHDDYGDHHHGCRQIADSATGTDRRDPYNEECMNHGGEWEPSGGD